MLRVQSINHDQLVIEGFVEATDFDDLEEVVRNVVEHNKDTDATPIEIDCSQMININSLSLAWLISFRRLLLKQHQQPIFADLSESLKKIIFMHQLDGFFNN